MCWKITVIWLFTWLTYYEPPHDKINKMACAPSEDSDQPGHPPSLIRVFAVRMKKAGVHSYPLSAQRRLISLGESESWLGTHAIFLVLSWGGSYNEWKLKWQNIFSDTLHISLSFLFQLVKVMPLLLVLPAAILPVLPGNKQLWYHQITFMFLKQIFSLCWII